MNIKHMKKNGTIQHYRSKRKKMGFNIIPKTFNILQVSGTSGYKI